MEKDEEQLYKEKSVSELSVCILEFLLLFYCMFLYVIILFFELFCVSNSNNDSAIFIALWR